MASPLPLVDAHARHVTYVRLSVTDRCNFRCTYCLPEHEEPFAPREDLLTFEEIVQFAGVFERLGVRKLRLTGGEPTARSGLVDLVAMLRQATSVHLAMTSNGAVLGRLAHDLARAGLDSVNISLDTLSPERFRAVTRGGDVERVVAGVDASVSAGLRVQLNAVALRGINDGELAALCNFAWSRGIQPRFIEFMPFSEGMIYDPQRAFSAAEIRAELERSFAAQLLPVSTFEHAGPARLWALAGDSSRVVGVISAVSEHFCDTCNRVRVTAKGELHTCLGYDDAVDLRTLWRTTKDPELVASAIRAALLHKRAGHEFTWLGGGAPRKHMITVGG